MLWIVLLLSLNSCGKEWTFRMLKNVIFMHCSPMQYHIIKSMRIWKGDQHILCIHRHTNIHQIPSIQTSNPFNISYLWISIQFQIFHIPFSMLRTNYATFFPSVLALFCLVWFLRWLSFFYVSFFLFRCAFLPSIWITDLIS